MRPGCLGQRVQGPASRSLFIVRLQFAVRLPRQAPRRVGRDEAEDHAALGLGQPGLPPGAGAIGEPVEPLGVEAEQPFAHRLGMAAQLLGDRGRPEAVPAPRDHPRPTDPVPGRVPAPGQLADAALLSSIERWAGTQQLRHGGLLALPAALFVPPLRNRALILLR
jgi:hypothetical protein